MSDPFDAEPSLETTASRFAATRAALRASPLYLPPCPLCSVVNHREIPDIIRTPQTTRGRRGGLWSVQGHRCELMPDGVGPWFADEVDAVAWWRAWRLNAELSPNGEERRQWKLKMMKHLEAT